MQSINPAAPCYEETPGELCANVAPSGHPAHLIIPMQSTNPAAPCYEAPPGQVCANVAPAGHPPDLIIPMQSTNPAAPCYEETPGQLCANVAPAGHPPHLIIPMQSTNPAAPCYEAPPPPVDPGCQTGCDPTEPPDPTGPSEAPPGPAPETQTTTFSFSMDGTNPGGIEGISGTTTTDEHGNVIGQTTTTYAGATAAQMAAQATGRGRDTIPGQHVPGATVDSNGDGVLDTVGPDLHSDPGGWSDANGFDDTDDGSDDPTVD